MTDRVLTAKGGDWRILGVSLRSLQAQRELAPQNGLYTLLTKSAEQTEGRVIASIAGVLCAAEDSGRALAAMMRPQTKIISLTVTEKAYGLDRARQVCDPPIRRLQLIWPILPRQKGVGIAGQSFAGALAGRRAALYHSVL